ncbi:MAG TPA: tetratricopeptide repeat protein, partial [Blastocatellia bacterium]|nr:tetratricopeptide repeat protein [Blastocatellia bacterium]
PLGIVTAVAAAIILLCRRMPEVKAALIWMVIPLLPHLNTRVFVSEELIHDRYLYISLLGFGLLVAALIIRAIRSGRLPFAGYSMAYLPVMVLVVLLVSTILQNKQWHDEETLWARSAAYAPNSRLVHISLGIVAETKGDYQGALQEYERVLEINPDVIDALNNAAFIYARHMGQWPQATRYFEHIVSLTPDKPMAHFNLSFAYAVQKRYEDAAREQRAAIELAPNEPRADEWRKRLKQLERADAESNE